MKWKGQTMASTTRGTNFTSAKQSYAQHTKKVNNSKRPVSSVDQCHPYCKIGRRRTRCRSRMRKEKTATARGLSRQSISAILTVRSDAEEHVAKERLVWKHKNVAVWTKNVNLLPLPLQKKKKNEAIMKNLSNSPFFLWVLHHQDSFLADISMCSGQCSYVILFQRPDVIVPE